jgi:hypothetical protein
MTEMVVTMPRIKARSTFGTVVARARLTRPQLAAAAEVSVRTVDALANPGAAGRHGFAREVTAWKIAQGFAKLTQQTDDAAFGQLFENVAEGD